MKILEAHLNYFGEVLQAGKVGYWKLNLEEGKLDCSAAVLCLFEVARAELDGSCDVFFKKIHPEDRKSVLKAMYESLRTGLPYEVEYRLSLQNGRLEYILERGRPYSSQPGQYDSVIGMLWSVTERKALIARKDNLRQHFLVLAADSVQPIALFDRQTRLTYANRSFERLAGRLSESATGLTPSQLLPDRLDMRCLEEKLRRVLDSGDSMTQQSDFHALQCTHGDCPLTRFRLVPQSDGKGEIVSVLAIGDRDKCSQTHEQGSGLDFEYFDSLTGMPNRICFKRSTARVLSNAERSGNLVGIVILDLDHFKVINDALGHASGDFLLQEVSTRLRNSVRGNNLVARMGDDEFAILIHEVKHEREIETVVAGIVEQFGQPFQVVGEDVFLSVSIGIAIYPKDGTKDEELLRHADTAVNHSKAKGRKRVEFFTPTLEDDAKERVSLESMLRKAVESQEFDILYQPQIDLRSGKLKGVEALLRWNSPEKGVVTPDKFIGIAEDTGLIVEIGEWVLEQACRNLVRWNRQMGLALKIAVNISARQFKNGAFVSLVKDTLERTQCPPQQLELEITESLLLIDSEQICRDLKALSRMGVSLAIDDFGTGYSSLAYLNRFPIHVLKIDRSFINDIVSSERSVGLVKAIVAMAISLDLHLVAEGIETSQQDALLKSWGCDTGQGYFYSRPISQTQFEQLLATRVLAEPTQV